MYVAADAGTANSVGLSIDLVAPATPCSGSACPSDIDLPALGATPIGGTAFAYAKVSSNFVAGVTLNNTTASPIVCDEIRGSGAPYAFGPVTTQQFSPSFTNASPGGMFEFGAGGPSAADMSAFTYDGSINPAALSLSSVNTTTQQVSCYPISAIGTVNPLLTRGTAAGDRIFYDEFEAAGHFANEPWVSVQTVYSPGSSSQSQSLKLGGHSNALVDGNSMGYVLQVHNASHAIGWHVVIGYDYSFFDTAVNGGIGATWCVLGSGIPQPGPINGTANSCGAAGTNYSVSSSDIQTATNSVYVYVQQEGSSTAASNWASLAGSFYPAAAAVFAPPGQYPRRLDDKAATVSANNVPVQNVGSIVCANDPAATSCMLYDADGNASQVSYTNSVSSGAVTIDPVAYFVDPNGGTTLPGNNANDALVPSGVSCVDASGILASTNTSFSTSTTAQGAQALAFSFATNGPLFIPGTATCTATFSASGFAPILTATQTFTITMLQATATHFAVAAPATATAGTPLELAGGFTVTAQDAGNNTVTTYSGTVTFNSSDTSAILPANSTLTNGVGTFDATLKMSGNQTITATDTVQSGITGTSATIVVDPAAATHFRVNAPGSANAGVQFGFAVTALDPYGNTDTNYGGTVQFGSTDGAAALPPNSPLTFGIGSFNATLNTTGSQTITATDTNHSSITGTSGPITVSP